MMTKLLGLFILGFIFVFGVLFIAGAIIIDAKGIDNPIMGNYIVSAAVVFGIEFAGLYLLLRKGE